MFNDTGGREGDVRRLGALRATVFKAVQGSAGGGDTWGTRGRRKGTRITRNKNIIWGIWIETDKRRAGTVNRNRGPLVLRPN